MSEMSEIVLPVPLRTKPQIYTFYINGTTRGGRRQGHNHGWKVEGDQVLGPNTVVLVPHAWPKAVLGVGCGRGSPLPLWGSGVSPRENFWKLRCYAKSCIFV